MNARKWMEANFDDHVDAQTGLICMTTMAEACAIALYGRCAVEREFDVAFDVAERMDGTNKEQEKR